MKMGILTVTSVLKIQKKSLSVIGENVVEEEVEILETEEITPIPPRKTVKINKKAKVANVVRRERKLF